MPFGLLFWILMLFWLFGWFWTRPTPIGWPIVPDLLLFVLIGLIGWKVFGPPLHP